MENKSRRLNRRNTLKTAALGVGSVAGLAALEAINAGSAVHAAPVQAAPHADVPTTTRTVAAQNVARPAVFVPGLGNVVSTNAIAGSSSTPALLLTITGLSLSTSVPSTVILQARQSANANFGFADQFVVQVITTSATQLLVRIQRVDNPNSGWGQSLRLDILIFDQVNNP